jgi:uncharacterized membrane protein YidH (DUF202 family)
MKNNLKPISLMTLLAWLISATTAGYLLPQLSISNGGSIPISPWNIIVTLPMIGVVLVLMAIPMFRYRAALRELKKHSANSTSKTLPRPKRLNPFYAVRLVLLAKSIAISGAIFSGWHLGVVWLQLTQPIVPTSTLQNALGLIGAIVMTVCAVIVERICKITDDLPDASTVGEPA